MFGWRPQCFSNPRAPRLLLLLLLSLCIVILSLPHRAGLLLITLYRTCFTSRNTPLREGLISRDSAHCALTLPPGDPALGGRPLLHGTCVVSKLPWCKTLFLHGRTGRSRVWSQDLYLIYLSLGTGHLPGFIHLPLLTLHRYKRAAIITVNDH